MKIAWNRVTWYSKAIALWLFIMLPIGAFFGGWWYGNLTAQTNIILESNTASISTGQLPLDPYYLNVGAWQTDQRADAGFSIAYPLDFSPDDNYGTAASTDWRLDGGNTPGMIYLTITVPSAFEPQTNFADAKITVGASGDPNAVAQCLAPDQSGGPITATSTITINNGNFTVFHSSDAAAGSYYQTTSYRTVHNGKCYAVEYTIHASQIANYPASYGLQPFNEDATNEVLQSIVGTFKFL